MTEQIEELKNCEICESERNIEKTNYLCEQCELERQEEIKDITIKDALKEFKYKSRVFKKHLKEDFESIKEEYPFDSFGDESFEDFLENTINATYDLEDEESD